MCPLPDLRPQIGQKPIHTVFICTITVVQYICGMLMQRCYLVYIVPLDCPSFRTLVGAYVGRSSKPDYD